MLRVKENDAAKKVVEEMKKAKVRLMKKQRKY